MLSAHFGSMISMDPQENGLPPLSKITQEESQGEKLPIVSEGQTQSVVSQGETQPVVSQGETQPVVSPGETQPIVSQGDKQPGISASMRASGGLDIKFTGEDGTECQTRLP